MLFFLYCLAEVSSSPCISNLFFYIGHNVTSSVAATEKARKRKSDERELNAAYN